MSQHANNTVYCDIELNFTSGNADVPEWVHVLATDDNGVVRTLDGRGPWTLSDPATVIERTMRVEKGKLLIDVNHATDHAAPLGQPAPAIGWVVELEARKDGLWGKVEWNASGHSLVKDKAYRALSPAVVVTKDKEVFAVPRLSLTNNPNLRGMAALNQKVENTMLRKVAEMLGLDAETTEEDVLAALEKALKAPKEAEGGAAELNAAIQAGLPKMAAALGLDETADFQTILNAVEATPNNAELAELQKTVNELSVQLNSTKAASAQKEAETFVDAAIAEGRVGVNQASRDRYIKMHLNSKEDAEEIINGLPKLTGTTMTSATPSKDGSLQLNSAQAAVAAQLGMSEKDYAAELANNQEEVA